MTAGNTVENSSISHFSGSRTLLQQNPRVLNSGCLLAQVNMYNSGKTAVGLFVKSVNDN